MLSGSFAYASRGLEADAAPERPVGPLREKRGAFEIAAPGPRPWRQRSSSASAEKGWCRHEMVVPQDVKSGSFLSVACVRLDRQSLLCELCCAAQEAGGIQTVARTEHREHNNQNMMHAIAIRYVFVDRHARAAFWRWPSCSESRDGSHSTASCTTRIAIP